MLDLTYTTHSDSLLSSFPGMVLYPTRAIFWCLHWTEFMKQKGSINYIHCSVWCAGGFFLKFLQQLDIHLCKNRSSSTESQTRVSLRSWPMQEKWTAQNHLKVEDSIPTSIKRILYDWQCKGEEKNPENEVEDHIKILTLCKLVLEYSFYIPLK